MSGNCGPTSDVGVVVPETVKEARIRAALEQVDRFGGVHEPLAKMLVDKIRRILGDTDV